MIIATDCSLFSGCIRNTYPSRFREKRKRKEKRREKLKGGAGKDGKHIQSEFRDIIQSPVHHHITVVVHEHLVSRHHWNSLSLVVRILEWSSSPSCPPKRSALVRVCCRLCGEEAGSVTEVLGVQRFLTPLGIPITPGCHCRPGVKSSAVYKRAQASCALVCSCHKISPWQHGPCVSSIAAALTCS